ncbi:glycine oxidase ThiO [Streptomyces sp. NPDC048484]|uniref:glycine oxidase ThiO n=1 Tax=Streptomyces sp. NPDC048484 TaxID=3155146 RepID=UPI00344180EC
MHIVIAGAGVIGLATGWRLLQRGLGVTVIDPAPGSGASHAAAGMLTPIADKTCEDGALLRLCLASHEAYPDFVTELEEVSGLRTGYRRDGILEVAFGGADLAVLENERRFRDSVGVASRTVSAAECRELEPMMAPEVSGGLLVPGDGSIDPRLLTDALLTAFRSLGGTFVADRVTDVLVDDRATGVRLGNDDIVHADRTVLAAGCWTHRIGGLPPGVVPEIRPVKGQTLRLRPDPAAPGGGASPKRTTRGRIRGSAVYLVPRTDGELVVGSTHEDRGYDRTITVGGLWKLMRDAQGLLPGVADMAFAEAAAGLRPGSPDDLPLLGSTIVPDLLLATGHFRFGVMLTPVSAGAMADLLVTGELPEVAKPFSPDRFAL